jgi:putative oxidoreductase
MDTVLVSALLRLVLGVVYVAHGWNHGFGPGGLAGTAGWFDSIGLRPARLQAAVSSYLELAVGAALLLGIATPFAAAAGVGVMTTAFVTVHRPNGFFIVKEGYEYVLVVATALTGLAALGPGRWSLDHAADLVADGWQVGVAAAAVGVAGAAAMLAVCWRPPAPADSAD